MRFPCFSKVSHLAAKASDNLDEINWAALGRQLCDNPKPYHVKYIEEVDRAAPVDVDYVRSCCERLRGFRPYWAPPHAGGKVRALLIGINYYGSRSELSGCVNDVRQEMATLHKMRFPIDEVAILVDDPTFPRITAQPTRDNMLKYMAWLVKDAKPGDVLFLHYSGHGTQTRSTDLYERKDQVIAPVDYETAGVIVDNDLYKILAADLPAGVRMTAVFDCCNSGTIMDLPYITAGSMNSRSGSQMKKIRNDNQSRGDILVISASTDSQLSAEAPNTNGGSGVGGAATQCFTYVLQHVHELTYRKVLACTREMLTLKDFDQTPQLSSSHRINLNAPFSLTARLPIDESAQAAQS